MKLSAFELILLAISSGVCAEDAAAIKFKKHLTALSERMGREILDYPDSELEDAANQFKNIDPDFARISEMMIHAARFRAAAKKV